MHGRLRSIIHYAWVRRWRLTVKRGGLPKAAARALAVPSAEPRGLLDLEKQMLPVGSVRTHFARPPSAFDGFRPLRAFQDLRIVDLVNRGVNRTGRGQLAHGPRNGEPPWLALHPGDAPDPGHLQQIWDVFGIVDFVEQ